MPKIDETTIADRRREAAAFAQDIIQRVPRQYQQIPRNLMAIAAHWDIRVAIKDLEIDGIFLRKVGQDGGHILVARRAPRIRQRFTVAHELGHYFHDTTHAIDHPGRWIEEREADAFASALLIPPDDLVHRATPQPLMAWFVAEQQTHAITELARYYAVSLQTLLQALVDFGLVEDLVPWVSPGPVWRAWERLRISQSVSQ
ncbi:hypothetical protein TPY_2188 [Sulfobacillus acidophilus TPY]|uniref:IrrE N-terminal-like domain-containing protein n=1 Tax=Sulfobacillus acidophilus (strain ATCC 700253 / DSM 10332 / NAL) TaxID=679936 RepID=G8TZ88_SULAD|nr:hypothetical protein TPY_2188 [Sulfobacillus acidophilus TPY]AEW04057.1 protein of unknown function DUF955 [Sulfobacillus acidophilus DSM 10332]